MLLNTFRSLAGQGPAGAAVALTWLGALRSHASDSHRSAGRWNFVWEKVLLSARASPEKLHDIVDVLSMHCITTQTAPPLDSFNELLRLCDAHGDVASAHKLTQMAMAVSMHLDEHTFTRMQSLFQYFPRPFPESARTASSSTHSHTMSSNNNSSSSSSQGSTPSAHGAGGSSSSSGSDASSSGSGYTSHSSTSYPGGVSNGSSSSSGPKGVWVPLSSAGTGPQASAGANASAAAAGARSGVPDTAAQTQASSSSGSWEGNTVEAPAFGRNGPSSGHGRMRD